MRVGQILDIVWKEVIVHKGTNLDEGKNLLTGLPKPTAGIMLCYSGHIR